MMNDLPSERVFLCRKVDLKTGYPSVTMEVVFSDLPKGFFDWREIGTLAPNELDKYRYEQSSNWPYPPIDAHILRTIADRIETLNARAQENEKISRPTRHPSPVL